MEEEKKKKESFHVKISARVNLLKDTWNGICYQDGDSVIPVKTKDLDISVKSH